MQFLFSGETTLFTALFQELNAAIANTVPRHDLPPDFAGNPTRNL
jgi:hypothetical protein